MIYPTPRAILLVALGAAPSLILALVAPSFWVAGLAWLLAAAGLILVDVLLSPPANSVELELEAPRSLGVGREGAATLSAVFPKFAPRQVELALSAGERLSLEPRRQTASAAGSRARALLKLKPLRRGEGRFEEAWARWRGPLGLAFIQRSKKLDAVAAITPDVQSVKDEALRLFARDAPFGAKVQLDTGEGAEFHALKEYQPGMDLRSVDWKQSARHGKLIGREYRTERNHHIILALDTGRLMCAPLAGAPRIDRAINAALLLAFVSLKLGDRVGLFAFDAKPRVASGVTAGAQSFPLLQRLAASIDYTTEETNFTLGLSTLLGRLDRRSLVVVFTDFADPTSAELMIENVGRLLRTHHVLFVAFRDEELESLLSAEPQAPEDVSRAVVAGTLLQQRELVFGRLTRMGAQIVDAPAGRMGTALVNAYLDAKRRDLL
ncbi:DUF58 domain-containing protein [Phenylobacterium sp.]|jgi:uncharacterized protein (DUF58 family)|uniref:DUF58 domain-containing protein n=1 Tax=Phenylobacterium sp. TaxID=1871053 RepID=UPI002E37FA33|nr:DUF58 domain-containing protein [Phenylobacterium sp.]HEX2559572.1 DUF58 domain-containing protein [Phenylobacterium sp.]